MQKCREWQEFGKLFQIFAKYLQSESCCKKVSKKEIHTGTVQLVFFHYVNASYTMSYYIQRYIKTFQNNETIKYKHQTTFHNEVLCSEGISHSLIASLIASQIPACLNSFRISSSSPCICLYKSTIQLAWSGFKSDNLMILWCLLGHYRFLIAEELDLKTSGRIGFE